MRLKNGLNLDYLMTEVLYHFTLSFKLPYIPAYKPPFFEFLVVKVWGEGAYTTNIKRRPFFQNQSFGIHPYDDELDDVAVDFLF